MSLWRCTQCNYTYDPVEGDFESGIKLGTQFEELPESWVCPVCGVPKRMFEKIRD